MAKAKKIPVEKVSQDEALESVEQESKSGFPAGVVGQEYLGKIESQGTSFVLSSGSLPEGIKLDAATGELAGVPTPESQGISNFKVLISNDEGRALDEVSGQIKVEF